MLKEEVWAAGSGLQLVFLDSDTSFPSDLQPANIHPMFVYIEVARQKASVTLMLCFIIICVVDHSAVAPGAGSVAGATYFQFS